MHESVVHMVAVLCTEVWCIQWLYYDEFVSFSNLTESS